MANAIVLFAENKGVLYMDKEFESINLHAKHCGFLDSMKD